jgi:hypothetical protein
MTTPIIDTHPDADAKRIAFEKALSDLKEKPDKNRQ